MLKPLTLAGLLTTLLSGGILARPARAQEMPVPVEVQVPIFLKVLKYDRGFAERVGEELVVGVVYQERFRDSLNALRAFEAAIDPKHAEELFGVPCRWVAIDWDDGSDLGAALARERVDVLHVMPLRAVRVEDLAAAVRGRAILTLAAVPEYVDKGLMIGVTARRSRPLLLINLSVAKQEGFDFASELLRIAQVRQTR